MRLSVAGALVCGASGAQAQDSTLTMQQRGLVAVTVGAPLVQGRLFSDLAILSVRGHAAHPKLPLSLEAGVDALFAITSGGGGFGGALRAGVVAPLALSPQLLLLPSAGGVGLLIGGGAARTTYGTLAAVIFPNARAATSGAGFRVGLSAFGLSQPSRFELVQLELGVMF
ncbi:MAG: hypothetical protein MUF00_06710 [Gemmatimonadaceae bacterium]|jgi:hypothetical protein|nr:hypothetical protein [Gemmatimonadaceae bacterium]